MKVITKISEIKEIRKNIQNKKIGFVPTMGGLHSGHLSLINRAKNENEITIVSVFLNPTQFNDKKDLETYPANLQDDITLLEKADVDFLFAPSYAEMYPDNYKYKITENSFSKLLCGASRPGHFDGVLTVVMKLFSLVRPANAYFGEKDFQQYKLLKGMAEAFFLDINIVPCPIVREESGLALSSRNRKLSARGLEAAPKFHEILSSEKSVAQKKEALSQAGFTVDYVEEIDGRIYGAVFLENVRLIDNLKI